MTPSQGSTLPMLPVPDPAGLADTQRRGKSCLWCGVLLTAAAAVDLGERTDSGARWFPRGCRPCARVRVDEALTAHRAFCEQCVEVDVPCPVRDAWRGLLAGGER